LNKKDKENPTPILLLKVLEALSHFQMAVELHTMPEMLLCLAHMEST